MVLHCPTCRGRPVPFATATYLEEHYYSVHFEVQPFYCAYCGLSTKFSSKQLLVHHYLTVHGENNGRILADFPEDWGNLQRRVKIHVDMAVAEARRPPPAQPEVAPIHQATDAQPRHRVVHVKAEVPDSVVENGARLPSSGQRGHQAGPSHVSRNQPLHPPPRRVQFIEGVAPPPIRDSRHRRSPQAQPKSPIWRVGNERIRCHHCKSHFKRLGGRGRLLAHINKMHLKLTTYRCVKCNMKFMEIDRRTAVNHVRRVHYNNSTMLPSAVIKACITSDVDRVKQQVERRLRDYFPDYPDTT